MEYAELTQQELIGELVRRDEDLLVKQASIDSLNQTIATQQAQLSPTAGNAIAGIERLEADESNKLAHIIRTTSRGFQVYSRVAFGMK